MSTMAAFGRLLYYQVFLSSLLLFIEISTSVRSITDPPCRCISNYDSRASFHDVSCYGINTEADIICAKNYLSNISAAVENFRMTFNLYASNFKKFPSDFLEPYSVIGLVLNACKISKIPKRLVSPVCYTLVTLQIRNSDIKNIPTSVLPECIMLSSLLVQNNSVMAISAGAFKNVVNLQELDLRQNRLQNFTGFSGIESLKMLNLAHNSLERIDKDAFQSTPLLTTIFLNNNNLEALDHDAFGSLPELQYLDLSCNRLQSFSGFSGIGNLKMLNLSSNSIHLVDGCAFRELDNLWMLYLDHNNVRTLDEGTFNPLDNSTDFALVSLEGNPIHCDCSLQWLQQWFTEHPKVQGEESTMCSSPIYMPLMDAELCSTVTTTKFLNDSTAPAGTTTEPHTERIWTSTSPKPPLKPPSNSKPPPRHSTSKPSRAPKSSMITLESVTLMGVSISLLYLNFMKT